MIGILNEQEIETFMVKQIVGRIGCHARGKTYVLPVSYVYHSPHIYIHLFEGLKLEMMRENPEVCFEIDDTKNLSNWKSVICWGRFEELKDEKAKTDALELLRKRVLPVLSSETMHFTPEWPFPSSGQEMVKGIFCRIEVREKTGRFEKGDDEFFYAT